MNKAPRIISKGYFSYIWMKKYINGVKDIKSTTLLIPEVMFEPMKKRFDNITIIAVKNFFLGLDIIQNKLYSYDNFTKICSSDEFRQNKIVIGKDSKVSPTVQMGENIRIGKDCKIHDYIVIGSNDEIGDGTIIFPNVSIYDNSEIGGSCTIQANSMIGLNGFRFERIGKHVIKIIHIGNVQIDKNVEIGSNTTIQRGSYESTIIRDNVNISSHVHIAHNIVIEDNGSVTAHCYIAGSCHIGEGCYIGIGTMIADNLKIYSETTILMNSVVAHDIKKPGFYNGYFTMEHKKWKQHSKKVMNRPYL